MTPQVTLATKFICIQGLGNFVLMCCTGAGTSALVCQKLRIDSELPAVRCHSFCSRHGRRAPLGSVRFLEDIIIFLPQIDPEIALMKCR